MNEEMTYKGWIITYNQKPITVRCWDYDAVHEDFDGENGLAQSGASIDDLKTYIDEINGE